MDLKRISLDTNAISNLFRGEKKISSLMSASDIIFIPIFVIAELHVGFKNGSKNERNLAILQKLESSSKISRTYPDSRTIDIHTVIFTNLRKQGKRIPVHDVWIAALTIQYDSTLISFARHFAYVEDLALWSK